MRPVSFNPTLSHSDSEQLDVNSESNQSQEAKSSETVLFDKLEPTPILLTAVQVGVMLNVSPKTLFHWAKTRFIPCVRMGRLVRFKMEDVEEFVARQRG